MDMFEAIADERRGLATFFSSLTDAQADAPSLIPTWKVRDVAGHLVLPLEVGLPRVLLAVIASGFRFERAIDKLAWKLGRRPIAQLAAALGDKADHRFTPPGMGPEAVLADVIVHGLDVRWPLGVERPIPSERALAVLRYLAGPGGRGVALPKWVAGLRFEADDLDWSSGAGALVRGPAEAIMLAMSGRREALGKLGGDGVALLGSRYGK
jgi:uncharacterized protein (TIGR03083 family)